MIKLQKLITNFSNWNGKLLEHPFNLIIKNNKNLFLFLSHKIKSDFSDEIIRQSTGIILDSSNDFEIICKPFDEFYTYDDSFHINNYIILKKYEGVLIKVYYYDNEWKIATKNTFDTKDGILGKNFFFNECIKEEILNKTKKFDQNSTYLFQLIYPLSNRKIIFLGKINIKDLKDYNIFDKKIYKKYKKIFDSSLIIFPTKYNVDLYKIKSSNKEFVINEIDGDRVLRRIKFGLVKKDINDETIEKLLKILINSETSEFETYLNETLSIDIKEKYDYIKKKYYDFIENIKKYFSLYKEMSKNIERKELALDLKKSVKQSFHSFIFRYIDHNIDINDQIKEMSIKRFREILMSEKEIV